MTPRLAGRERPARRSIEPKALPSRIPKKFYSLSNILSAIEATVGSCMKHLTKIPGIAIAGVALLVAVFASGCAGGSAASGSGLGPSNPSYEVLATKVADLGNALVDGRGFTLYLFEPDQAGRSRCFGSCATAWPPLLLPSGLSAPEPGPGIRPSLLGVIDRPGALRQVTYNGWPLYLWRGDARPGDATGEGVDNMGGLWFAVSPDGAALRAHH